MRRMRRRQILLASAAWAAVPCALAQRPGRVYRVGVLFNGGSSVWGPYRTALLERLAQHGFVEGTNLEMLWRGGIGVQHEDRDTARQLVDARPDALVTYGTSITQAAQWATKTIPIVFSEIGDPVADGIVKEYAHPGANVTGVADRRSELLAKRFELLRELAPKAKRVVYVTPGYSFTAESAASASLVRQAAARLGFELIEVLRGQLQEIEEKRAEALLVFSGSGQRFSAQELIDGAVKLRIPCIFETADYVASGGLASYGADPIEDTRLATDQLVRVLKGARPGDVPVDQSARFVLAINLRIARAIGLTVPQSIMLRADQVIE